MLQVMVGNVLRSPGDILVCPTNTKGVMGAGLARVVRDNDSKLYLAYRSLCSVGMHDLTNPIYFEDSKVLCLATKEDWRDATSLDKIAIAVETLNSWMIKQTKPLTIALPLLGGGNGKYSMHNWKKINQSPFTKDELVELIIDRLKVPARHIVYLHV